MMEELIKYAVMSFGTATNPASLFFAEYCKTSIIEKKE